MAKSLRSKVKRAFRSKKREDGVYAAHAAARAERLHSKLAHVAKTKLEGTADEQDIVQDPTGGEQNVDDSVEPSDAMTVDVTQPQRISTHGPRGSRREEWRKSKGMVARPAPKGLNRQGVVAARRKSGRAKRRR